MKKKVNCNKCKKNFIIKPKVKKHKEGIEELYFKCPHCKEKYTAFYIDKEGKELQKKIKVEYARYNNISVGKEETLKRIKDMQIRLDIKIKNLKRYVEGTHY